MWHGIVVCLALVSAEDVAVKPLQGEVVRGELVALTEKSIAIKSAAGEVKWNAAAVQWVKPLSAMDPAEPATSPSTAVVVELLDGSLLPGVRWTLAEGRGTLESLGGTRIELASRLVRSVKFRQQTELLRKQWDAIVETPAAGDQLVVRKAGTAAPDAGPVPVVLDQLEGVIHAVTPTAVGFEFDGEKINVPLEKVEGILLRSGQPVTYPDAVCTVRDGMGGLWQVQSLQFAPGKLICQTVSGAQGEIAWAQVREIDFSAGNLTFLSDLKPESVEWRPYLVTPATPPVLAKWFSLRRDQTIDGSALTLAGQSYEKGLAVHSRSLISYRLTKSYQRFQAVVGVDERFRGPTNLKFVITGDERALLTRDVRGSDPPFEIDLDMSGVRRLKILVDFGEDRSDAGDHLLLCNARLTK